MCPRFRGCVRRHYHPHRGTKVTRRVASVMDKTKNDQMIRSDTQFSYTTLKQHTKRPRSIERHGHRVRKGPFLRCYSKQTSRPKGCFEAYARNTVAHPRGIPLTRPRRPISISIKDGAHVPLLENAHRINDLTTRASYESVSRQPLNILERTLAYSAGVAV